MIPISRMYDTEAQAREAVSKLMAEDCDEDLIHLIAPPGGSTSVSPPAPGYGEESEGEEAGTVAAAPPPAAAAEAAPSPDELIAMVKNCGTLPRNRALFYSKNLAEGRWLVVTTAQMLMGSRFTEILDECDPIDQGGLPLVKDHNPSPFSDFIGMPTLEKGNRMSFMSPSGKALTENPHWTFSSLFGMSLLSNKATPLSSMFNMKVLSDNKPKDKSFGLPLLSKNRPWKTSFGLPLLTNQNKDG